MGFTGCRTTRGRLLICVLFMLTFLAVYAIYIKSATHSISTTSETSELRPELRPTIQATAAIIKRKYSTNEYSTPLTGQEPFPTPGSIKPTKDHVHIAVSIDSTLLDGLVAMIHSVIQHSYDNRVVIHIVVNSTDRQPVENRITCSLSIPDNVEIEYTAFDVPENVKSLIKTSKKYLRSSANFVRFFFGQIFPRLSYVLYLDVDLILQHNVGELWKEIISTDKLLVVASKHSKNCVKFFKPVTPPLYYARYHKHMNASKCPDFNAGVVGYNLDKWRKKNATGEVIYWMGERFKQLLWGFGTQPLLYIVSIADCKTVDNAWNKMSIAYHEFKKSSIEHAYILHWNGQDKPWGQSLPGMKGPAPNHTYDYIWLKHNKKVCSDKGMCEMDLARNKAVCHCDLGYEGEYCENKI